MKKFVIERNLPGAGSLSSEELRSIAQSSNEVINDMEQPYQWIQSFVTNDKIYCVHFAENEAAVREHARRSGFPINTVAEIKAMMDPLTSFSK